MKLVFVNVVFMVCFVESIQEKCQKKRNVLDCSSKNISTIDLSYYRHDKSAKSIIAVDLSNNHIQHVYSTDFEGFENLQEIVLSKNNIQTFDNQAFLRLEKLHTLHIEENKLTEVPTLATTSLLHLNLNSNKISRIKSKNFWKRNKIQNLTLSNNLISDIQPQAFDNIRCHLHVLSLKNNRLVNIPTKAIRQLTALMQLDLRKNKLNFVKKDAFRNMTSLEEVMIFDCSTSLHSETNINIINIHPYAFRYMKSLKELKLHCSGAMISTFPNLEGTDNINFLSLGQIKNLSFPYDFCHKKTKIQQIYIELSSMKSFPSLSKCKELKSLEFFKNTIEYIPSDAFSGLPWIKNIKIAQHQNSVQEIHHDAFSNLPLLAELDLSHLPLKRFPNLNGTQSLTKLYLHHCKLTIVPDYLCENLPGLEVLNLALNDITVVPQLSKCLNLESVYLYMNQIKTIDKTFIDLKELRLVDLHENHIEEVGIQSFKYCSNLRSLNMSRNLLKTIHIEAFRHSRNIRRLDISHNYYLTHLPSKYLQSIQEIKSEGNRRMINFPTQEDLPHATRLSLFYPYHCCFFLRKVQQVSHEISINALSKSSQWRIIQSNLHLNLDSLNMSKRQTHINIEDVEPWLRLLNNESEIFFTLNHSHPPRKTFQNLDYVGEPFCTPTPNEFYPCEDLMGRQWLRICVWVVFLLSFVGNTTVLLVSICNFKKLDVPRYLIINLAFADLCLSTYLGFLTFVDISTLGDFRSHAINWQFSSSCKSAGFLAVFATELSVYTLAAITVERFTTIKYSIHVVRRMTTRHAFYVVLVGWVIAFTLAALPINSINGQKFSDYTKYSVCLPFDIEDLSSKAYVTFLLMFNLIAFLVVLFCYIRIYFFIRGSNAWNSGDSRAARRMAMLVFTDFFCWLPIAITALSAVYDSSLLPSLWMSKILTVFIFPLNACANPFLYAILTKQFRKDFTNCVKKIKDSTGRNRGIRRSLLKIPVKSSLTYSTSVRRASSCSFLFGRRWSSKTGEDIKFLSRNLRRQTYDEPTEYTERLTSV